MKVQELLTEKTVIGQKWKVDKVDVQRGIQLLNRHCSASLADIASGNILFRGFSRSPGKGVFVLNSTNAQRTSKDSTNLYQLALDTSTKMRDFPSRSNSFICTGDIATAIGYSDNVGAFAMIPFDGTTVAVGSKEDFFHTVLKNGDAVSDFDFSLKVVFNTISAFNPVKIKPDKQRKFTDAEKINSQLSQVSPEILMYVLMLEFMELGDRDKADEAYDDWTSHGSLYDVISGNPKKVDMPLAFKAIRKGLKPLGRELLKQLEDAPKKRFTTIADFYMDPQVLKLSLQQPGSLKLKGEAWFSGKCVAIDLNVFHAILKQLGSSANKTLLAKVSRNLPW